MKRIMQGILLTGTLTIPLIAQEKKETAPAAFYEFWKNSDLHISAWGSFNYSVKSTFSKQVDSAMSNTGTYASPSFGATAWYGNSLTQVGLSIGYMQIYSNTATV